MLSELILTVVTGLSCASNTASTPNITNDIILNNIVLKSNNLDNDGYFELDFYYSNSVTNCNVQTSNLNTSDLSSFNNNNVNLILKPTFSFSNLVLNVESSSNELSKNIYFYTALNFIFYSDESYEDAWINAFNHFNNNDIKCENLISDLEYLLKDSNEMPNIKNNQEIINENPSAIIPGFNVTYGYVKGCLQYNDINNNIQPLRGIFVGAYYFDVSDNEFYLLGQDYTDDNGNYLIEVGLDLLETIFGKHIFIKIFPQSLSFEINKSTLFSDELLTLIKQYIDYFHIDIFPFYKLLSVGSSIGKEILSYVTISNPFYLRGSTTVTYDYTFENDDGIFGLGYDKYKAFVISQGLYFGQKFAQEVLGIYLSDFLKIQVCFPLNNTSFNYTIVAGIRDNEWNNWQVILHEYRHYIEWISGNYGNNINDIINNDATHTMGEDLLEKDKNSKGYAIKLAWMESWATVFSLIVYDYYSVYYDMSAYAEDFTTLISDFEDMSDGKYLINSSSGEAQEATIIGLLWDLYDDENDSQEFDNVSLGPKGFYDLTTYGDICTLESFVEHLYNENFDLLLDISKRMEYGQLAPKITSITYDNDNLTIRWKANGSSNNPFDTFDIILYETKEPIIYKNTYKPSQANYDKEYFFTIERAILDKYLNQYTNMINVTIEGYYTNKSPRTGPYRSSPKKAFLDKASYQLAPKDYGFTDSYPTSVVSKDIAIGDEIIQTERLRCGYIQNSTINLSARRDNAGEAYLKFNFPKKIHGMIIEISFWSQREFLTNEDSSAKIYYEDYRGVDVTLIDLLNDITLSTDKNNPNILCFEFTYGTDKICIHSTSSKIGNINKGRISIGNIIFF